MQREGHLNTEWNMKYDFLAPEARGKRVKGLKAWTLKLEARHIRIQFHQDPTGGGSSPRLGYVRRGRGSSRGPRPLVPRAGSPPCPGPHVALVGSARQGR